MFNKMENSNKRNESKSDTVIGIDLGTTFSCVGVFQNHHVDIISDPNGYRTIPSYVFFSDSGEIIIGHNAKRRAKKYPKQTIYDAKRFIGKQFSDPIVQKDIEFIYEIIKPMKANHYKEYLYQIVSNKNGID